jgi:hypothetical protein
MTGLTLAEAFHLMSRALGELPAPVPHETLRARMAALHGKEDPLLDAARFDKLLRQANDAEIADVRMIGENQFEISQHKSDLALQMRAPVDSGAAGSASATTAPVVRAPAALRFRGGSRSATRLPAMQMVGVVDMNGDAIAPAATPVAPTESAVAARVASAEPVAEVAETKGTSRRGKLGGAKQKTAAAAVPVAETAKPAKAKKPSKPRTSKPRAG